MKPNWILTTICGFSAALLIALLSLPSLSTPLHLSVACLAVAFPLLASAAFLPVGAQHSVDTFYRSNAAGCLSVIGIVFSLLAYACVFFHFALWTGIIFFIACAAALGALVNYRKIGNTNK